MAEHAPSCRHCGGFALEPDAYPAQPCSVCHGTGKALPPAAPATGELLGGPSPSTKRAACSRTLPSLIPTRQPAWMRGATTAARNTLAALTYKHRRARYA